MEQVIELGNMPALKIHVQVVKKVDSVFKVALPLALDCTVFAQMLLNGLVIVSCILYLLKC